jgi:hypothetical protein
LENKQIGNEFATLLTIKFKDEVSEKNFYELSMRTVSQGLEYPDFDKVVTNFGYAGIEGYDASLEGELIRDDIGVLLKDVRFNGKETEMTFKAFTFFGYGRTQIVLRSVSEEYFNYKATKGLQNNTSGDPFAQPVNVFNNINNGFGIFAGYSQSVFSMGGPEPVVNSITPMQGKPGDHIIISGANFTSSEYSDVSVSFKSDPFIRYAEIVRQTETELEVVVPEDAVTGKIAVYANGYAILWDTNFVIQ